MPDALAPYMSFIYLGIFVVIFYLFLIRPQQKQQKQRVAMLDNLKKGDKIINHGGIMGTITEMKEDRITVRISEKAEVTMLKEGVARVLNN